jgi:hypothetical protein
MPDHSASPAIDILSMSYLKYCDFFARVIDEVNDSIVALANPVSVVVASELLGIVGPGVRPKPCDLFDDSATIFLRADGFDFLGCRGLYEKPISGHAASDQPRTSRTRHFSHPDAP